MSFEISTGRYRTRWSSLGAIPATFIKYLEYERRRIAITLFLTPVPGAGSILVTIGDLAGGFSYRGRDTDPGLVSKYTLRKWEVGGIVCGEVYALMTTSSGTLTVVEYLDNEL